MLLRKHNQWQYKLYCTVFQTISNICSHPFNFLQQVMSILLDFTGFCTFSLILFTNNPIQTRKKKMQWLLTLQWLHHWFKVFKATIKLNILISISFFNTAICLHTPLQCPLPILFFLKLMTTWNICTWKKKNRPKT